MTNEIYVRPPRLRNPWHGETQSGNEAAMNGKGTAKEKPQPYHKSPALRAFENEYNARKYDNSTMPDYARIKTRFNDKTANGLTAAIIAHLEYNGHFAARVNTCGLWDAKRGAYRRTNARKGMADISAVINGKPVQIEIKAGEDKPRVEQLQVAAEYEAAGGKYLFVHTFSEWVAFYGQIIALLRP